MIFFLKVTQEKNGNREQHMLVFLFSSAIEIDHNDPKCSLNGTDIS